MVALALDTARRWPIILLALICALVGMHYVLKVLPPQYKASVQLLIVDPTRSATASLMQIDSAPRAFDPVEINTEVEIIKSASALQHLARSLHLDEVPEFQQPGLIQSARLLLGLGNTLPEPAEDNLVNAKEAAFARAVTRLYNRIYVDRSPLSYVVTISAIAGRPELSYEIVKQLVDEYLKGQSDLSRQSLDRSSDWLGARIAEMQIRLNETNAEIERLRAQGGIANDGKATLADQERSSLSAKLVAVRAELSDRKSRLDMARAEVDRGIPGGADGITSTALAQMRAQLLLLERDEAQLNQRFGSRHAQVVAIQERLNALRRVMSDETARIVAEEQAGYNLAQRRDQDLVAELDRLGQAQINASPLARIKELTHTLEADQRLIETYSSRLQNVQATQSIGGSRKRILSPALMPSTPIGPVKMLFYAGAGVVGGLIGVALAGLSALLSRCIPPAGPGQRRFDRPVLGNIPILKKTMIPDAISGSAHGEAGAAMAAAMRSVRVGLQLQSRGGSWKLVVVTSAVQREGRSTVAAALASSTARSGIKTLLVDGDLMSRPSQHSNHWSPPGLIEALTSNIDPLSVVRRDLVLGCHVMEAGSLSSANEQVLVSGQKLHGVLGQLRQTFGLIIIDVAPLLPVPEACTMLNKADAVLLVVDASRTRAEQVTQALDVLREAGSSPVSLILNRQPLSDLRKAGLIPERHSPGRRVRAARLPRGKDKLARQGAGEVPAGGSTL